MKSRQPSKEFLRLSAVTTRLFTLVFACMLCTQCTPPEKRVKEIKVILNQGELTKNDVKRLDYLYKRTDGIFAAEALAHLYKTTHDVSNLSEELRRKIEFYGEAAAQDFGLK